MNVYYEWILSSVFPNRNVKDSYFRLIEELNNIDFIYTNPLDQNRDIDGKNLINHFSYRANIPIDIVRESIPEKEHSSVLEMMIALSFKIEDEIMSDPHEGDRTSIWFKLMLDNLGLSSFTDQRWIYGVSEEQVRAIIYRFLNRDILPNGEGGLFILSNPYIDLRTVDIWTQANWYISENYI